MLLAFKLQYASNLTGALRSSPLGDVVGLIREPHQSALDLNADVKCQQEVQASRFAVSRHHVTEC